MNHISFPFWIYSIYILHYTLLYRLQEWNGVLSSYNMRSSIGKFFAQPRLNLRIDNPNPIQHFHSVWKILFISLTSTAKLKDRNLLFLIPIKINYFTINSTHEPFINLAMTRGARVWRDGMKLGHCQISLLYLKLDQLDFITRFTFSLFP